MAEVTTTENFVLTITDIKVQQPVQAGGSRMFPLVVKVSIFLSSHITIRLAVAGSLTTDLRSRQLQTPERVNSVGGYDQLFHKITFPLLI